MECIMEMYSMCATSHILYLFEDNKKNLEVGKMQFIHFHCVFQCTNLFLFKSKP